MSTCASPSQTANRRYHPKISVRGIAVPQLSFQTHEVERLEQVIFNLKNDNAAIKQQIVSLNEDNHMLRDIVKKLDSKVVSLQQELEDKEESLCKCNKKQELF